MSEDDIQDGDAMLFHTGWGDLWGVDNDRYNAGVPGIGIEVGRWLSGQNTTMVGGDTWPVGVVPGEDSNKAFPVHNHLLTENGILIHENLNLSALAAVQRQLLLPVPSIILAGSPPVSDCAAGPLRCGSWGRRIPG